MDDVQCIKPPPHLRVEAFRGGRTRLGKVGSRPPPATGWRSLFVCLLACAFVRSLVRSFVRAFPRSFVRSFAHSFVRSFYRSGVSPLVVTLICRYVVHLVWWCLLWGAGLLLNNFTQMDGIAAGLFGSQACPPLLSHRNAGL